MRHVPYSHIKLARFVVRLCDAVGNLERLTPLSLHIRSAVLFEQLIRFGIKLRVTAHDEQLSM